MGVNSLPKTVTRQRHSCDLNPGPSAPESSTLTTRLPSHRFYSCLVKSTLVEVLGQRSWSLDTACCCSAKVNAQLDEVILLLY